MTARGRYSFRDFLSLRTGLALVALSLLAALLPIPAMPARAATISFEGADEIADLSGLPTSIDWGPDQRLYVGLQNGRIEVYEIQENGNNWVATQIPSRSTNVVRDIDNHGDDGDPAGENKRLLTGIHVAGTASNPVIFATSSDPRIGGGTGAINDLDVDTNSGTVSRLTWSGGYDHDLLVKGLPRSEENHGPNGLWLDQSTNILYVAQGGNTNKGAPSDAFALLPEYALSAAILAIDLDEIGSECNLTTIGSNNPHCHASNPDPWGGDEGDNQSKKDNSGASPVKVFAPGFRNPYDVVITAEGSMYTIDNGGNAGWGNIPGNEGPGGSCNNSTQNGGTSDRDALHRIASEGQLDANPLISTYYGGHPNPVRGNPAGSSFPSAVVGVGNDFECDYQAPPAANGTGGQNDALVTFDTSTNSIVEYGASIFDGEMKGDLLAVEFNFTGLGKLYHIDLNPTNGQLASGCDPTHNDGNTADDCVQVLLTPGPGPLAVTALGDGDNHPGLVIVGNWGGGGNLVVYEPIDNFECSGADNPNLDQDFDGYDNADEIDAGTNPCSAGSVPADNDDDGTSDVNDPDDDNDGISDVNDEFAIDPQNGESTNIPVTYGWENVEDEEASGILGLGFTGLMTNGSTNYLSQFDPADMTAGGAAGVMTVDAMPNGDARGDLNNQQYGFQLGVEPLSSQSFSAHTRLIAPFASQDLEDFQSLGLFIGTGTQDDYVKVVAASAGGGGGIQTMREVGGSVTDLTTRSVALPGPNTIDLWLTVDPQENTVTSSYSVNGGTRRVGAANVAIPSSWLNNPIAVGILGTSRGPAPPFAATWDFIEVVPDNWATPGGGGGGGGTAGDFIDIAGSTFIKEINWLADEGITKGCNPPANDEFCPEQEVTRGQMSAFLHRALDDFLSPGAPVEFVDDNGNTFEGDIEWLGATGVTRGCNPPTNDRYCPDDGVTRAQMAAFLHRALGDVLTSSGSVEFTDDGGTFEGDIEWLGATGVTKGCNPPVNDRFCPNDVVTREQMAAFLYRALES